MMFKENENIDNMALFRYIINECNYGGMICDQSDISKLDLFLDEFFNDNIIQNRLL